MRREALMLYYCKLVYLRASLEFLPSLNFSHKTSTNDYIYVYLCSTFNVNGYPVLLEGIIATLLRVPHSHKAPGTMNN